tara:strand:+ start:4464 stop:5999 length:1536 start_codon:yes stop_codon:yes gene_type:complete
VRRIGIDVGGTNTDAVLLDGDGVVAKTKTATTSDVMSGIRAAMGTVLEQSGLRPGSIDAVMIGTTHFTNAVVQRRGLQPMVAIRIGLPASRSLGPFVDWPDDLRDVVRGDVFMIEGGHEYDGRPIVDLDETALVDAAHAIARSGLRSVAVAAAFSPLTGACEGRAAEVLADICPDCQVTLSHRIGRIGLLERENAALLNASLEPLAHHTTQAFRNALAGSGLEAKLYLTQNDGTVLLAEQAERFPVFSFASGPTNSMRGAAFLSGRPDGMVVDVGGTTADIGMLQSGFPREANNVIEIGGVRTLFRMPDLVSIGLGGGSLVDLDKGTIGPESTGYELISRAMVFGGNDLTTTDLAVAAGLLDLGNRDRVGHLNSARVGEMLGVAHTMAAEAVDRMKTAAGGVSVLAVGGGSFLIPDDLPGASEVIRVEHGEVANAVGAAIAQVSGECDQVFTDLDRDEMLAEARQIAEVRAVEGGADRTTLKIVEVEDLPLAYLPGNAVRARVRVVGDIAA